MSSPAQPSWEAVLEDQAPDFRAQLEQDGRNPVWLDFWGQSLNWDEIIKQPIVDPRILDPLFLTTHAPPRQDRIVHAGIMHVYGYLFSNSTTPYGYKRARWVDGEIEAGLGFPRGVFSPTPPGGTQFANVTYLLARIALVGEGVDRMLLKNISSLDGSLLSYRFQDLEVTRLEETLGEMTLRSDFVEFPHPPLPGHQNTHLLIYSVKENSRTPAKLFTAFPVSRAFVNTALNEHNQGLNLPISSRYNAYVPGVTGVLPPKEGTRKVVDRPS